MATSSSTKTIDRQIIRANTAPKITAPISHAIRVNDTLYVSGMLGVDPTTGALVEGGIEAETRRALQSIGLILTAANTTYENVVKTTVLLADINDFAAMNAVYKEFFKSNYPARAAYQVAQLPIKGARVEIESIAVIGKIVDRDRSSI